MTLLELIDAYGDARERGELGRERAYVLHSQIEDQVASLAKAIVDLSNKLDNSPNIP